MDPNKLLVVGGLISAVTTLSISFFKTSAFDAITGRITSKRQRDRLAELGYSSKEELLQAYLEVYEENEVLSKISQNIDSWDIADEIVVYKLK